MTYRWVPVRISRIMMAVCHRGWSVFTTEPGDLRVRNHKDQVWALRLRPTPCIRVAKQNWMEE